LTGFLDKKAAGFCKELWDLMLSAQDNSQGVPTLLLEEKKQEILASQKVNDSPFITSHRPSFTYHLPFRYRQPLPSQYVMFRKYKEEVVYHDAQLGLLFTSLLIALLYPYHKH
jgi:hypothetical protein